MELIGVNFVPDAFWCFNGGAPRAGSEESSIKIQSIIHYTSCCHTKWLPISRHNGRQSYTASSRDERGAGNAQSFCNPSKSTPCTSSFVPSGVPSFFAGMEECACVSPPARVLPSSLAPYLIDRQCVMAWEPGAEPCWFLHGWLDR